MASSTHLTPHLGPDGLAMDHPVIAYTEKVLEEKELELKRYIEDNYSKIRNVERELASLALEIKLTAGPKKAALEHLRKKIELSAEKIKVAKQREEQAKKVWEAATKVLKEEEENKQNLCEDLNRLVQESAATQYSRLEELKKKLEALNPELAGGASLLNGKEAPPATLDAKGGASLLNGKEAPPATLDAKGLPQKELPKKGSSPKPASLEITNQGSDGNESSRPVAEMISAKPVASDEEKSNPPQQGNQVESRIHNSTNRPAKGRSSHIVKGPLAQKTKGNNWTGAGFDVDDRSEA